jgi:hypothetical protein
LLTDLVQLVVGLGALPPGGQDVLLGLVVAAEAAGAVDEPSREAEPVQELARKTRILVFVKSTQVLTSEITKAKPFQ